MLHVCEGLFSSGAKTKMVMPTIRITPRLHLWAEFDGAFYRPQSTQARTFGLKCLHYGSVDGGYFYLTKHFPAVFLRCTFPPLQITIKILSEISDRITTRNGTFETFGNIFTIWSAAYDDLHEIWFIIRFQEHFRPRLLETRPSRAIINFNLQ